MSTDSKSELARTASLPAETFSADSPEAALQATYEVLRAAAVNFDGTLAGKLVLGRGLDALAGAQPLAATMQGAAFLSMDPDAERIKRCVKSGYCEVMVNDLDEALRILKNSVRRREPASVGLISDCAGVIAELAARGVLPDLFFPNESSRALTANEARAVADWRAHGAMLLDLHYLTEEIFGPDAEPFLYVALSGAPADLARADRALLELFPANDRLQRWLPLVKKHVLSRSSPSRVIWLSRAERTAFARAVNDLVAKGEIQAPIGLGRPDSLSRIVPSQDPLFATAIVADGTAETAARIESVLGGDLGQGKQQ